MQDCSSGMVDRMCTACDVNAVDALNLTALDYCIYKGDSERADLMVKNGARMDPVLLLHMKCKRCGHEHSGEN
jgi:ankyrin repeat protein